ncbi:MAG: agmatinase family protein [Proteobacteria bacterium]|nr:agmatinase family protein [Pseudomonadota bacterium]
MTAAPTHLGIISLPFEVSTSFLKGTREGPSAILHELESIDPFDFDLAKNPFEDLPHSFIHPHDAELDDSHLQQSLAYRAAREIIDSKGFPLSLGGEHSVSIGAIRAARSRGALGIVQLDAHADLRDEYEGNPLSHACAMRRAIEMDCSLVGVGIRAISREEAKFVERRGLRLRLVEGRKAALSTDWYKLLNTLPDRVYLTVDMDVFNPSEVPAVGTPEPGGPSYEAVTAFLHHLFKVKNVVAADIVELRPSGNSDPSVRLAARLAGLITGLRFKK